MSSRNHGPAVKMVRRIIRPSGGFSRRLGQAFVQPALFSRRAGLCGVGDQLLVGVGVDGELLDVEGEGAHDRVAVGLGELLRPAHPMTGPPGAEVRVPHAQFADQRGQGGVVRGAAGLHPQDRDAFAGGSRPVRVQGPEVLVEEGQPDQVALGRGQRAEVGQQGGGAAVPGQHVHAAAQDHRGDVGHGLQQLPQPRGDLGSAGPAARRRPGRRRRR